MRARHEYKININAPDYLLLKSRLQKALARDRHAGPDGSYSIQSIYFDTPDDRALRDKIDGVNHREKFRIRYYNGDLSYVKLEKKSKHNGLCYKRSCVLNGQLVRAVVAGAYAELANQKDELLLEFYDNLRTKLLRPKIMVEYTREAFVFRPGNVRITLDSGLRTAEVSSGFFDEGGLLIPAHDVCLLLEVKYDTFLPAFIGDLIQIGNRRASANSKYAMCRVYG